MGHTIREIHKVSKTEQIKVLESLTQASDKDTIKTIVSLLDHLDIEIRGEAFSTLMLNKNNISETLIQNLSHHEKNIRAYTALILGNRGDQNSVEALIKLASDKSSNVRSCALGALGYLKANNAKKVIRDCFFDENLDVKKSALKASIDVGDKISADDLSSLLNENNDDDDELNKLIAIARKSSDKVKMRKTD